jgi:hypothetical protein
MSASELTSFDHSFDSLVQREVVEKRPGLVQIVSMNSVELVGCGSPSN